MAVARYPKTRPYSPTSLSNPSCTNLLINPSAAHQKSIGNLHLLRPRRHQQQVDAGRLRPLSRRRANQRLSSINHHPLGQQCEGSTRRLFGVQSGSGVSAKRTALGGTGLLAERGIWAAFTALVIQKRTYRELNSDYWIQSPMC
jgi:hypothetical protein